MYVWYYCTLKQHSQIPFLDQILSSLANHDDKREKTRSLPHLLQFCHAVEQLQPLGEVVGGGDDVLVVTRRFRQWTYKHNIVNLYIYTFCFI